jgi:hypothetical protein
MYVRLSMHLFGFWVNPCIVCFKVYDLNGDRYISKEEMFQLLQHCLVRVCQ